MGIGLLKKAILSSVRKKTAWAVSLDKMGPAIMDRIEKLPIKSTGPYIALCLMKAYGGFDSGVCLVLKNGVYKSGVTVGLGLEKISLGAEKIFSQKNFSKKYFRLNKDSISPGINSIDPSLEFWVFPMDGKSPWEAALLLAAVKSAGFEPDAISEILDIFNFQLNRFGIEEEAEEYPRKKQSAKVNLAYLEEALTEYGWKNSGFGVIAAAASPGITDREESALLDKLNGMVSYFGKAIPFSGGEGGGKNLVLVSNTMDLDLLAHRLKAGLHIDTPLVFKAESSGEALEKLKSFR